MLSHGSKRAMQVAASVSGVRAAAGLNDSLLVRGDQDALDRYVIALGSQGVAIRHLERRTRSLETLFQELTSASQAGEASVVGRRMSLGNR